MKTITLWQPWASLIAKGHKKIETRSWKAPDNLIGQRIAIHAAAKIPIVAKVVCLDFAIKLGINGYNSVWLKNLQYGIGTFGKVVATANLVDCLKVIDESAYPLGESVMLENQTFISGNELMFGDYTIGRYAWILDDIEPLAEPIPAKGKQRIWEWDEKGVELIESNN